MIRYDIHVHVPQLLDDAVTDNVLLRRPNRHIRAFRRHLRLGRKSPGGADINADFRNCLIQWAHNSDLDRFVLLAMDRAYAPDGSPDRTAAIPRADNGFVAQLAARCSKFRFGASIHPYRKDALAELTGAIMMGACLVKWIPSAQGIHLDSNACVPFYEMLATSKVPLLVHTGNEHATSRRHNHLNDPALLTYPLRRGVTVIAAHCGARMFLHERCHFVTFCRMAREHENLYGDIAAFGIPTRIALLRKLQRQPDVLAKVLYGSDFPGFVMPRSMIFWIGLKAVRELVGESNPLQRPCLLMRKLELPDTIFTRAADLLHLDRSNA